MEQGVLGAPIAGFIGLFVAGTAIYLFFSHFAGNLSRHAGTFHAADWSTGISGIPRHESFIWWNDPVG